MRVIILLFRHYPCQEKMVWSLSKILQGYTEGTLDVFYHPDFVAFFSSRGPVSPFYMKPDIVAPGAFINTTNSGGNYKIVSGTSFAAPHVAGIAALVLQKKSTTNT